MQRAWTRRRHRGLHPCASNKPIYYNAASNTTVELPFAAGKSGGKAYGVNDNGLLVGQENSTAFFQSVVGGTPGTGYLLNNFIASETGTWNLQDAYGLDNNGDIVGEGTLNGTAERLSGGAGGHPRAGDALDGCRALVSMAAYAWRKRRN